jgi:hypothetical protein
LYNNAGGSGQLSGGSYLPGSGYRFPTTGGYTAQTGYHGLLIPSPQTAASTAYNYPYGTYRSPLASSSSVAPLSTVLSPSPDYNGPVYPGASAVSPSSYPGSTTTSSVYSVPPPSGYTIQTGYEGFLVPISQTQGLATTPTAPSIWSTVMAYISAPFVFIVNFILNRLGLARLSLDYGSGLGLDRLKGLAGLGESSDSGSSGLFGGGGGGGGGALALAGAGAGLLLLCKYTHVCKKLWHKTKSSEHVEHATDFVKHAIGKYHNLQEPVSDEIKEKYTISKTKETTPIEPYTKPDKPNANKKVSTEEKEPAKEKEPTKEKELAKEKPDN